MWEERLHGGESHGSLTVMIDVFMVAKEAGYSASTSKGRHHTVSNEMSSKICRGPEHLQAFLRKEVTPHTRLLPLPCSPGPQLFYLLQSEILP